jgi:glycosyltransferase involved in cell wall biosynthesis
MAVQLANMLPPDRFQTHLCTTRSDGALEALVDPHVARLGLKRRHRYDAAALRHLVAYNRRHRIAVLHAHGTSVFVAVAAALFPPRPAVVWHVHFGRLAASRRTLWYYRVLARHVTAVIAVSRPLAVWSRRQLKVRPERVWQISNVTMEADTELQVASLPGTPGSRIVCVANLRPEKDHLTLLAALRQVVAQMPDVHLLLVGSVGDAGYAESIRKRIADLGLERHVTLLGFQQGVWSILRGSDVGVLSSEVEGLPLALLEYGAAGLPVVVTDVGECRHVLGDGRAGFLVPPKAPEPMAAALMQLLSSPELRRTLGHCLRDRIRRRYSAEQMIDELCSIYELAVR